MTSAASGMGRLVGASVRRVEDPGLLTGRGRFVDDLRFPGMLHAALLRSPFAHARLVGIDAEAARARAGVAAVLTGADLQATCHPFVAEVPLPGARTITFWPLAVERVRFVGEPVALVVAGSRYEAEDALESIDVAYEPLPVSMSADGAMAPGVTDLFDDVPGNVVYQADHHYGDVATALAAADRVVRRRFSIHRQANSPMETRGGVAVYDPATDELLYHATTQIPHLLRVVLSGMLKHPQNRLHVIAPDIGGSFGLKWVMAREDVAVCAAARRLGRPVKWVEDRNENLLASGQAREDTLEVEAGFTTDGVLLALRVHHTQDMGAYPAMPLPAPLMAGGVRVVLPSAYRLAHYDYTTTTVCTNKAPYVPYRGPQAPEAWVRERLLDEIARELGIEPADVRRRNLLRPDEIPTKLVTGASLDVSGLPVFERAMELCGVADFRKRQQAARAEGRHLGFGVANILEPAPGPPDWADSITADLGSAPETVRARLEPDGTLTVFTPQSPHGQSHRTTLAQVAADELGVRLDQVRVTFGDTRIAPFGLVGTGGSRAASLTGRSVAGAVRVVRAKVLELASLLLEAAPGDLEIHEGIISVRGVPQAMLPLAQVAMVATMAPHRLPPGADVDLEGRHVTGAGEGGWWTPATHCCEVEVSLEDGRVRVDRFVVVEDCGTMINPAVVDGQIRGGVAHGIGGVLLERAAYAPDGQFMAGTWMDYLLPTATDVPPIEVHHLLSDEAGANFRGVGEGGAMLAPAAISNAVADALAHLGVTITEQHLPPSRVLELAGIIAAGDAP